MISRRLVLSPLATLCLAVFVPALLQGKHVRGQLDRLPVEVISDGVPLPPAQVEKVAHETLMGMQNRLGMALGDHALTIQVCPGDRAYMKAGGLENTDACYLAPDTILLRGYRGLRADLAHEFAHVLIGERTQDRCPVWMEEGVINHENHALPTGQYDADTIVHLNAAIRNLARRGEQWTLDGLGESSQEERNMTDAFYGASWSATDYLYRTYGRASVLHAINRMADTSADRAFLETFGRTRAQIEQDWKATLR